MGACESQYRSLVKAEPKNKIENTANQEEPPRQEPAIEQARDSEE